MNTRPIVRRPEQVQAPDCSARWGLALGLIVLSLVVVGPVSPLLERRRKSNTSPSYWRGSCCSESPAALRRRNRESTRGRISTSGPRELPTRRRSALRGTPRTVPETSRQKRDCWEKPRWKSSCARGAKRSPSRKCTVTGCFRQSRSGSRHRFVPTVRNLRGN